jgi:hypothetical protein
VALFVVTHGLLAVTVRIGQFSYVAIGGLLLFLPAVFWRDIAGMASRTGVAVARVRRQTNGFAHRLARVLPRPPYQRFGWNHATQTLSVVLVAFLLVWGADMAVVALETTDQLPDDALPYQDDVDRLKEAFGVEQPPWTIFAPNPSATDEWFVVAVETQSGYRYDLHTERPLSFDRPEPLNTQWDTYRERFYWDELGHDAVGDAYRRFVCRGGDPQVSDVAYITVYQITEVIEADRPETYWNPSSRERNTDRLYTGACGDRQPRQVPLSP